VPVAKDSLNGPHMIEYFAMSAAWLGENDLACEQLAKAEQLPGYGTMTYGQLTCRTGTHSAATHASSK
jgi:hypothetical protein